MKKFRLLPLLILALVCLCLSASAASLDGPDGQVYIGSVTDQNGAVTTLTDGNTTTVWTQSAAGYGADLTINLYSATVGEIWIRNGHCYSQNYYNHFDRPSVIAVTLWYSANRYTSTSVTYRYRMSDSFRPGVTSSGWNNGYQRMLLPEAVSGVTRIELTIESATQGYGRTGATITDVLVCTGSHATATPRAYATATPRPYVQYITPSPTPYNQRITPTPYVQWITPTPTRNVQVITPTPTRQVILLTPEPTSTPLVELITPPVTDLPTDEYPSEGVEAKLLKSAATRSGPSNDFDEPGSFFSKGTSINVISKAWDPENELWWFQIEFNYRGEWMRAYTPENRIDLAPELVPTENDEGDAREVLIDHRVYFGPGYEYKMYMVSMLYKGSRAVVYAIEDGWAQVQYHDYATGEDRRGWVPVDVLSTWPFAW